jgi:hypothetical protein
MAYDGRVYQILIASPSDVKEEHEIAVRVIQDWNHLHSNKRRIAVLPLRWETHTAPEYNVRPQEAINRQIVDDCDLVVAIFWTRFGTRTGESDSGTLEEIERVAKAGKPVMLYFSHVPVDPNSIDFPQMKKVKTLREVIATNALIDTFASRLEFHDKFTRQLEMKIRALQEADNKDQPQPLELQFLSLETGKPDGKSISVRVDLPEFSGDIQPDTEVAPFVGRAVQALRDEAALVPIPMAITNVGPTGIRNLYVQMSLKPVEGCFQVSHIAPSVSGFQSFVWASNYDQPSDLDRRLARLRGEGLTKDDEEWKYAFEWDALQPERDRRIEPTLCLQVTSLCKAKISAKVFAENFTPPIVLAADITISVQPIPMQNDAIIARAKQLLKASKHIWTSTSGNAGREIVFADITATNG